MLLVPLIIIVVLVVFVISMYNGLVSLKVQCDNAWSDIDVQLKRRYDRQSRDSLSGSRFTDHQEVSPRDNGFGRCAL